MKKKIISMLLCAALTASLAGCGQSKDTAPATEAAATTAATTMSESGAGAYTAGTYTGTAKGRNGDITVEVTVIGDEITSVVVKEHQETEGIADPAIERIPQRIVEGQSLGIDAIAGATITGDAILEAVAKALEQAGADVEALKAKKVEKTAGETVEKTADVIIVGGGGAGISAAAAAASEGKTVILIEKTAALGGNTLASGGVWNAVNKDLDAATLSDDGRAATLKTYLEYDEALFEGEFLDAYKTLKQQITDYLAEDTSHLFDSVEFHLIQSYLGGLREDLDGNSIHGDYELLNTLVSNSDATIQWLEETAGSEFNDTLSEPIGSLWLRAQTPKNSKQVDLFDQPAAYVESNGGEIIYECTAEELIVEDGAVTGVNASMSDGTKVILHGNNGVILATGGFGANTEMVMQYDNYWGDNLYPEIGTTNVSATVGEGITMAQEAADADVTGMEFTQLMPIGFASNGQLALGNGTNVMYVTPEGKRFVDEYAERDVISQAAFDNGGEHGLFYEVGLRSNCALWNDEDCFEADTIEELAEMIGMDPAVFSAEVEKYNGFADAGKDDEFGKSVFTTKIETKDGDKYAARAMRPSLHHTMGGLVIDNDCHVINKSGEVIKGLYAAGEVIGGIHAGNRLGGNAIADIYTFGRIAGTNAANAK